MRAGGRGLALGAPLPARVGELPDKLLFLGIHADHRVPGALMVLDLCSLMYRNCASRSGCRLPSMVLALPCS